MNKQLFIDRTKRIVMEKVAEIEAALSDTQASANSETKSSAGEKHETSRAMAHLENERLAGQLKVLQDQLAVLQKINPEVTSNKVSFGSVVKTENGTFFLSTGIGKIKDKEGLFYAIASTSPIGKELIGKSIGEQLMFNSKPITIEAIY